MRRPRLLTGVASFSGVSSAHYLTGLLVHPHSHGHYPQFAGSQTTSNQIPWIFTAVSPSVGILRYPAATVSHTGSSELAAKS